MATLREQPLPESIDPALAKFDPADFPGHDGLARWRQARRDWMEQTHADPDLEGPLGSLLMMIRLERHTRLILEHGLS
jgi:hypothetical protein